MEKKYYNKILLNKYYGKNYDFLQGKPKNSYNIKGIRRGTSDFKTMELM